MTKNIAKNNAPSQDYEATFFKRFRDNMHRHPNLVETEIWSIISSNQLFYSTYCWMEDTQGEPDIFIMDDNHIYIIDGSQESPKGRRSVCYDKQALESRKEHKPNNSAMTLAEDFYTELLNEKDYFWLQQYGPFDQKTSSWLLTPSDIREKGGAIFGDHRFGRTFIYHNGAESYYGSRGFRVKLKIK